MPVSFNFYLHAQHIIPQLAPRKSSETSQTAWWYFEWQADFKSAASFSRGKKALLFYRYKHKRSSCERMCTAASFFNFFFLFVFSVNVTASHFPTGHRIAAHLVHKEQREFANSLFPWAPIKTSFGKVAAFYPSLSQCVFFSLSLTLSLSLSLSLYLSHSSPHLLTNCRKRRQWKQAIRKPRAKWGREEGMALG